MKEKISYRQLFEGGIKFNFLLFILAMLDIYLGTGSFDEYYSILGMQLFVVFSTLSSALIYKKIHDKSERGDFVRKEGLLVGGVVTVVLMYLRGLYVDEVPFDIYLWLFVFLSLAMSVLYWLIIISLSNMRFLNRLIRFLDTEFTYKDFIFLITTLNVLFFIIISMLLIIAPGNDRNLFESLFVLIYFESAFFILHFIIAKIIDMVWHKGPSTFTNVSMLGVIMGSIFYVIKINVIDQSLMHLFYFDSTKSSAPLLAVVTLILFWSFFALLFHFEVKYPLKGRVLKRSS